MSDSDTSAAVQRLIDKDQIRDAISRYSRGVDRGDWELVRSGYHADAFDAHGDYRGDVDGLIAWLDQRFAGVDNSVHFIGQCLIEFAGPDLALVETYFVSRRLVPPSGAAATAAGASDAIARESWGRYVDRFERRNGDWRVAHRIVVLESISGSVASGGKRTAPVTWGSRDRADRLYALQAEIFPR